MVGDEQGNYSMTAVALMLGFVIALIFIIFQFISTPFFNPIVLLPVTVVALWVWMSNTEWVMVVHLPKMVFMSGVSGTIVGGIRPLAGGKFQATLSVKRRIFNSIPNRNSLLVSGGGAAGFIGILTSDVQFVFFYCCS